MEFDDILKVYSDSTVEYIKYKTKGRGTVVRTTFAGKYQKECDSIFIQFYSQETYAFPTPDAAGQRLLKGIHYIYPPSAYYISEESLIPIGNGYRTMKKGSIIDIALVEGKAQEIKMRKSQRPKGITEYIH